MFIYNGSIKRVKEAVEIANKLMQGEKGFLTNIRYYEYDMANVSADKIRHFMINIHKKYEIEIVVRRTWNPFSRAIAWFNKKTPLKFYLNKCKLKRSKHSIVGSILHEFCHLVDNQYTDYYFGHGSNNRSGKENTAPYKIGYIAKNISEAYY